MQRWGRLVAKHDIGWAIIRLNLHSVGDDDDDDFTT